MPSLVIGTTVPTFKALAKEELTWILHAEEMVSDVLSCGFDSVHFFAAIETDARGLAPFTQLILRLKQLSSIGPASGSYWTFSVDDHAKKIDSYNRLVRICTGRNLIHEFALRGDVSHVLFLDSDLEVPADSVSKLMEMDYPIVGGNVPVYQMTGPKLKDRYTFPVQEHWNTAGFLMVTRDIIRRIRWRADVHGADADGLSDDPCFALDVEQLFGYPTHVRKDLIGKHNLLVALERRGHDLRTYRETA